MIIFFWLPLKFSFAYLNFSTLLFNESNSIYEMIVLILLAIDIPIKLNTSIINEGN